MSFTFTVLVLDEKRGCGASSPCAPWPAHPSGPLRPHHRLEAPSSHGKPRGLPAGTHRPQPSVPFLCWFILSLLSILRQGWCPPKTNAYVIGNPEHVSEALRNGPVASSLLYASSSPIPFHRWDPEAEQGKRFSQSPTQPRASLALSDLFPVLAKSINLHLILQVSEVISHITFIPPVSLKIGLSYYVS